MDADDVGNFLSRWSRRKLGQDQPPAKEQPQWQPPTESPAQPGPEALEPSSAPPVEPLPPVESLTPESDFKPFMRPDVAPDVKQAAMKQLFKDPHFNVMDGLDTYIDDYSIADPIPAEMMKNLYQARQLLFTDEEKAAADAADAAARSEEEAARTYRAGIPPPIDSDEAMRSAEDAVREYEANVPPSANARPDPAAKA
jgi:hypothetical protein